MGTRSIRTKHGQPAGLANRICGSLRTLTVTTALMFTAIAAIAANASTVIYMYSEAGNVNVTGYYNYTDQHLYSKSTGELVGNVATDGTVTNLSGTVVGFVVTEGN